MVDEPLGNSFSKKALKISTQIWFLVAVAGQWIFAYYVLVLYGRSAVQGDFGAWNNNLINGIVEGDPLGNLAVAVHLILAVIITFSGPLQLIPQVRAHAPSFHRFNGRMYIVSAFVIGIDSLFMIWTRGSIGAFSQHLAISINGILVIAFAAMALRYALARNFATHHKWALRLFLVVSGVWFFRIGLMLWMSIHQGPMGFDPVAFAGPFLTFLAFAQFLLPLLILEIYFCTKEKTGTRGHLIMTVSLLILTGAMAMGIFEATTGMWLPKL